MFVRLTVAVLRSFKSISLILVLNFYLQPTVYRQSGWRFEVPFATCSVWCSYYSTSLIVSPKAKKVHEWFVLNKGVPVPFIAQWFNRVPWNYTCFSSDITSTRWTVSSLDKVNALAIRTHNYHITSWDLHLIVWLKEWPMNHLFVLVTTPMIGMYFDCIAVWEASMNYVFVQCTLTHTLYSYYSPLRMMGVFFFSQWPVYIIIKHDFIDIVNHLWQWLGEWLTG